MPRAAPSGRVAQSGRVASTGRISPRSNWFGNTNLAGGGWSSVNVTRTSGELNPWGSLSSPTDPSGSVGACKLVDTAANASHYANALSASRLFAYPKLGLYWLMSVWLHPGTRGYGGMRIANGATVTAVWNLNTGALVAGISGVTGNYSDFISGVWETNGLWRRYYMGWKNNVVEAVLPVVAMSGDTSFTYLGNGTDYIRAYGPQFHGNPLPVAPRLSDLKLTLSTTLLNGIRVPPT